MRSSCNLKYMDVATTTVSTRSKNIVLNPLSTYELGVKKKRVSMTIEKKYTVRLALLVILLFYGIHKEWQTNTTLWQYMTPSKTSDSTLNWRRF